MMRMDEVTKLEYNALHRKTKTVHIGYSIGNKRNRDSD